jgi:ribosomal protein S27E
MYATAAEADAAKAKAAAAGLEPGYGSLRKNGADYIVFRGNDVEKAKRYLLDEIQVTEELTYYVVETPDGNWGKDIDGLYLENLLPWQFDAEATDCRGDIVSVPSTELVLSAAHGQGDNFTVGVRCGNCRHEWFDGVRYQKATAVRCPSCRKRNRIDPGGITASLFGDGGYVSYNRKGDGSI